MSYKRLKDIALIGIMAALLYAVQIALRLLPNIELVSFLTLLFFVYFGIRGLIASYVFVIIEGLTYGFGTWWLIYLYIWAVLYLFVRICRQNRSPLIWALILGLYGLLFGALSSIVYFFLLGPSGGLSFFLAGIPYDITHMIGNFLAGLLLTKPVCIAMDYISTRF